MGADFQTNLFINNEYVPSSTGETLTIYNPSTEELVSDKVQVASEADVDNAVAAAKKAFPLWSSTPGPKRASIMLKFADLLEAHASSIGKLETVAMGQPVSVSTGSLKGAANMWRYYAGYAGKVAGTSFTPEGMGDNVYKIVEYVPLGVCAGICAWNGTHALAVRKFAVQT